MFFSNKANTVQLSSIVIGSIEFFFHSSPSVSSSYNCINIFCFVLLLLEAKSSCRLPKTFCFTVIFYCDNSVLLWAIWILWKLYLSQRCPELEFLAKKAENFFQNIDYLHKIASLHSCSISIIY